MDYTIKTLTPEKRSLTTTQVRLAISNSIINNPTGPDDINIRHLKHLGPLVIKYLTNMYNIALNSNTIPHLWKCATIILISKPNKDHNIGTYHRPLSLLSPIAKTLEKALLPCITENIPVIFHQHEFKRKHSTTTALHNVCNQITKNFNNSWPPQHTVAVALDTSKAFGTVNIHKPLN